jgi:hypothetical protein
MTTSVDTNIIIALWDKDPALSLAAEVALEKASHRGIITLAAPVFAELIAAPGRTESFVNSFIESGGPPEGHFNHTQTADDANVIGVLVAFSPTS